MKFKKETANTMFLYETSIENLYISEYMASSPGDYVKVYLMAHMYAQMEKEILEDEIAEQLMLDVQDIRKAWEYWCSMGIVRRNKKDGSIQLLSLRERLYGEELQEDTLDELNDNEVRDMYKDIEKILSRPLSSNEIIEIGSWLDDVGTTPLLICYAYKYCCEILKKDNVKYIGQVVYDWTTRGLTDVEALESYIDEIDQQRFTYKRIFKALGFMRNPTEEEKRIMNIWISEMGFSVEKILEACSKTAGIANPNIKYVDKILREWSKKSQIGLTKESDELSVGIVLQYYDYLREKNKQDLNQRRARIIKEIPEIGEIEDDIREKSMRLSRLMISDAKDKNLEVARVNKEIHEQIAIKAAILTENGYEMDYLESKYSCNLCKDTGTTENGERCICFSKRAQEAKEWQKEKK